MMSYQKLPLNDSRATLSPLNDQQAADSVSGSKNFFAPLAFLLAALAVPVRVETVEYREASLSGGKVTFTGQTEDARVLTAGMTAWADGTYAAQGFVTIPSRVTVTGTVKLILAKGAILTASQGITVSEGNTLKIYGQKSGAGTLSATAHFYEEIIRKPCFQTVSYRGAAIGGYDGEATAACGTIEIHGGTVIAQKYIGEASRMASCQAAGIGGVSQGDGGTFTMYGGTVRAEASGSSWCGGISGGYNGTGKGVTAAIYGGSLTAMGSGYDETSFADGIGTGRNNNEQTDHGTLTAGDGVKIWGSANNSDWVELTSPFETRSRYMKAEGPQDEGGSI